MSKDIQMDYGLMEEMSKGFQAGIEQLQDTLQEMQSIANTLEDGALLGDGGEAFTAAIRNKLCPAITRLSEKFEELSGDVIAAMGDIQEAEREVVGKF